jgi:hypothetical protein
VDALGRDGQARFSFTPNPRIIPGYRIACSVVAIALRFRRNAHESAKDDLCGRRVVEIAGPAFFRATESVVADAETKTGE